MGKRNGRLGSKSMAFADWDRDGEEGWVVVKKQRVTILVPSLPAQLNLEEPRQSQDTKLSLEAFPIPRQVPRMRAMNRNRASRMTMAPPGLRAVNLERKLARAGGVSRWLVSLGLHQFARLFKRKGLGKFQMVNLTMKKLKEMGANAVGPRRKLIHAIDCICHPHCFTATF